MRASLDPELTIRPVRRGDLAEIQTLFVDTISAICKADYSPDQIAVWISSIENPTRWTKKLTSQYFLVAQCDGLIVGFASLEGNDYLDFLYVHKDYQRQGVADRLYSEMEAEALQRGAVVLSSDVSITARPFFEKKGFQTIQTQISLTRGIEILNYKMTKQLGLP